MSLLWNGYKEMIITQKFDSIRDIEEEFITPIENLLQHEIPNFQYLLDNETFAPEHIYFNYILFFGPKGNTPIGIACAKISKKPKNKFVSKILGKKQSPFSTSLIWEMPSKSKHGFYIEEEFIADAIPKIKSLMDEYKSRDYIDEMYLKLPGIYKEFDFHSSSEEEQHTPLYFDKKFSNYQEYLNSLPIEVKKLIKRSWKTLQERYLYEIEEYKTLDDHYLQFCSPKQKNILNTYRNNKLTDHFVILEEDKVPALIIPFIRGFHNHYFYDECIIDESIPEVISHQVAILKMCTNEDYSLNFLGSHTRSDHLMELGFHEQTQLKVRI